MKKIIFIFTVTVLMAGMMSVTAFAHGGHGNGYRVLAQQSYYELCTVDGCDIVGPHQHEGVWYCNQPGCYNYEVCTVEGCTEIGIHEHDGTYYRCANYGTGFGCGRWSQ